MRTQVSIALIATGIVGVISAGAVSATVLMADQPPTVSPARLRVAAPAPEAASLTSPAKTGSAATSAVPSRTVPAKPASKPAKPAKIARITPPAASSSRRAAITYTVKKGDNLSSIAAWFALHGYRSLFEANRAVIGDSPDLIQPGQRITITGSGTMSTG